MNRKNLKLYAVPIIYVISVFLFGISIYLIADTVRSKRLKSSINTEYVSTEIVNDNENIPVVYVEPTIMRPFLIDAISINKAFYDYDAEETEQENAIILYENNYIQNSGVSYKYNENFEIISVLDGTVVDITDNKILGKTLKIRHSNDLVSTYQCLSEITINKDDSVARGQIIGKSGTCPLYSKDNNLHFELSYQGKNINPEKSYNKAENEL